jgi:hypothetical protein
LFQRRINRSTREGIRIWRPPLRHWRGGRRGKAVEGKGLGFGAIVPEADMPAQKKKTLGSGDHQQNTGEEDGWEGKRRRDGAAK